MRCVASLTLKATGAASSRRSPRLPALLRPKPRTGMSDITKARKALVTRILEGDGKASRGQRRAAFDHTGLAEPLNTLIDKVTRRLTGSLLSARARVSAWWWTVVFLAGWL